MKRIVSILLIAWLMIGAAWAEEIWYCKACGAVVSGGACPACGGTRVTTGLKEGEWVCECGRVNRSNYCGKCGSSRENALAARLPEQTETAAPGYPAQLRAMQDAQAGDCVTYGRYPQTAEGTDSTPIEWLVLERNGDEITLISRYALDCRLYHEEQASVTWETCGVRAWLNGEFLSEAFTDEESSAIVTTHLNNPDNPTYETPGGNDTDDRVFLLSVDEVSRFFPLTEEPQYEWCCGISDKLVAAPTAYAMEKDVWTSALTTDDLENINEKYAVRYPGDLTGTTGCVWWLRSPGIDACSAAHVDYYGAVFGDGIGVGLGAGAAVRPTMVLRIPQ